MRKPTGWLTNSQRIAEALSRVCTGDHAHGSVFNNRSLQVHGCVPIEVGRCHLAGAAGRAPERGVGCLAEFDAGPAVEEEPLENAWTQEAEFWDEISGTTLGGAEVRAARELEVEYTQGMGVYGEAA